MRFDLRTCLAIGIAAFGMVRCSCSGSTNSDSGVQADSGSTPGPDASADAGTVGNDAGADAGSDAGATDAGSNDAGTMTVIATRTVYNETDTGTINGTEDFAKFTNIAVYVPDSNSASGYDVYPGSGNTTGTITVPNVPANVSFFYLGYGNAYVEGYGPTMNLSAYLAGRPNVDYSKGNIQFDVSGMSPWYPALDLLEIASAGADFSSELPRLQPDGGLVPSGATSYTSRSASYGSIIDGTQGDISTVWQLVIESDGGLPSVIGAANSVQSSSFVMAAGKTTTFNAAFAPLPQTPVSWTFDQQGFEALASDVQPSGQVTAQVFGIDATPGGTHGLVTFGPPLFQAINLAGANWTAGGTYGNPLPSSWGLFGYGTLRVVVPENVMTPDGGPLILADSGTAVDDELALITWYDELSRFPGTDGGLVSPLIGPPTSFKIDNNSAYSGAPFARPNPILSWQAPAIGTVDHYEVQVDRVFMLPDGTVNAVSTFIYTTETSVQLFPGEISSSGGQYLVHLTAVQRPNTPFAAGPFIGSFPTGRATAMSGVWTIGATSTPDAGSPQDAGYQDAGNTCTTPPVAPTGLTVTAATTASIALSWTASTSPGVTGYSILRSLNDASPAFTQIGTSSTTTYSDTSINAYASYQYEVVAQISATCSSPATSPYTAGALAPGFTLVAPTPGVQNSDNYEDNFGSQAASAPDENGDPFVAFFNIDPTSTNNNTNSVVDVATWDRTRSQYTVTTLATNGEPGNPGSTEQDLAVAFDSSTGTLGVVYAFTDPTTPANGLDTIGIKITQNPAIGWVGGNVWTTTDLGVVGDLSMAMANGQIYLAFTNDSAGAQYLTGPESAITNSVKPNLAALTHTGIDANSDVYAGPSVAVDSTGTPAVTYWDVLSSGLENLVFWRPVANTRTTVYTTGSSDDSPWASLAFARTEAGVAIYDNYFQTAFPIYFKSSANGTTWSTLTDVPPDMGANAGSTVSLALGPSGDGALTYWPGGGTGTNVCGSPKLATSSNVTSTTDLWNTCSPDTNDSLNISGYYPTLFYGGNDKINIAFQDPNDAPQPTDLQPGGVWVWRQP
jgi:hypothetical protein